MSMKYELSIWRDYPGSTGIREEKVGILAATGMDFAGRAQNIVLKKEYTGKISLEFEIPVKYFDPFSGDTIKNPLCAQVIEKTKIKLWRDELWWNPFGGESAYNPKTECLEYEGKWEQGRWYDLIVSSHKEKRSKKQLFYSYTCDSLYMNELSRNGYSLQFVPNSDIMSANGMGTAHDLAKRIVDGTGWEYIKTEVFPDYKEEFNSVTGETVKTPVSTDRVEFSAGLERYCYCYNVETKNDSEAVNIIKSIEEQLKIHGIEGKVTSDYYGFKDNKFWWKGLEDINAKQYALGHIKTDISFNGADSIICMDSGDKIIYTEIKNGQYVERATGATSISKIIHLWEATKGSLSYDTIFDDSLSKQTSYLKLSANGEIVYKQSAQTPLSQGELYCIKIQTKDGNKASLKIKDGINDTEVWSLTIDNTNRYNDKNAYEDTYWFTIPTYVNFPHIYITNESNEDMIIEAFYFYELKGASKEINELILNRRSKSLTTSGRVIDLLRTNGQDGYSPVQLGTNLITTNGVSSPIWLGFGKTTVEGYQKETYNYFIEYFVDGEYHQIYLPINNNSNVIINKISSYNTDKRRAISGEKSNRFSLLEQVAKTFNCFTRFIIEHDEQGHIKTQYGRPIKRFTFVSELGRKNFNGFNYGVNLESIERTINANELVTKCHVESLSNEHTDSNMVTIQESKYNKLGMSFIYNFSYYLNRGLLDKNKFLEDYQTFVEKVGVLTQSNLDIIQNDSGRITRKSNLETDISTYELLIESYKEAAKESLANIGWENFIKGTEQFPNNGHGQKDEKGNYIPECFFPNIDITKLIGYKDSYNKYVYIDNFVLPIESNEGVPEGIYIVYDGFNNPSSLAQYMAFGAIENFGKTDYTQMIVPSTSSECWGRGLGKDNILNELLRITSTQQNYHDTYAALENAKKALEELKIKVDEDNNSLAKNNKEIQLLISRFEEKYTDYIIEGQWKGNDYIDADAYYLDATRAMSVSCMPKVSYTIGAIDLAQLSNPFDPEDTDWGKDFIYDVGDTSYVKDEELFGNVEQLTMISTITSYIDIDKQDNIEMRNYETRFEELFQQVAAAVTSVQMNENIWSKAAAFTPDGGIKPSILQKAIDNNTNLVLASANNSVIQDNRGLIVTDNDTGKILRAIGGGIFFSSDGGDTFQTGITPEGINASLITSGHIDTSKIVIYNTNAPAFQLNYQGLTALSSVAESRITRFDQFGIYSTDTAKSFDGNWWERNSLPDQYIVNNSVFSLTRLGLNFKYEKGGLTFGTIGDNVYGLLVKDTDGKEAIRIDNNGNAKFTGHIVATQLTLIGDAELPDIDLQGVIKVDDPIGNGNGEPSFGVTSAGLLTAENAIIKGSGKIGNWVLRPKSTENTEYVLYTTGTGMSASSNPSDPVFWAGYTGTGDIPWDAPEGEEWEDKCTFYIQRNGSGKIAGWQFNDITIYKDREFVENNKTVKYRAFMQVGDNNADLSTSVFGVKNMTNSTWPFTVTYNGALTSTRGKIGGWNINTNVLDSEHGNYRIYLASAESIAGGTSNWIRVYNTNSKKTYFQVSKEGKLKAVEAEIEGKITATNGGNIGGWTVEDGELRGEEFEDSEIGSSTGHKYTYKAALTPAGIRVWLYDIVTSTGKKTLMSDEIVSWWEIIN